jgi:hypothetical protein
MKHPIPSGTLGFVSQRCGPPAAETFEQRARAAALGPEPKAVAKGVKGDLDEPLGTDPLEHPRILRALLEMDFDPNETGVSGRTPLMVAARARPRRGGRHSVGTRCFPRYRRL